MNDLEVFDYECNGQFSMFDYMMPQYKIDNKIRLIELFAGYGSQAMALDIIGADYEHYKVVEFDKYAVQSYNAVHNTNFEPTDIRNVHGKDLEICNADQFTYMLTYSFPCTDLSVAGKMQGMKKGSGTRSGLLWEVERILTEIYESGGELPQVLFMENVPQVISSANIKDFHAWQDFLTSLGYTSYVEVLNAKDYGVADLSFPTSETRRGRVQDNGDTCPTITAGETEICKIESLYRIRKLTPRECFRLMGVNETDIEKIMSVNSNSQCYKQAGNSIVVNCMVAMFSNLNIQNKPRWSEIKDKY